MIDKKFFFDATMLTFPVEAHLSAFLFLWNLPFVIPDLYGANIFRYLCIITNTVLLLLLGIAISGSDNRAPSLCYLLL